jgi:nucleoside-diphosphate-sugar epimerase
MDETGRTVWEDEDLATRPRDIYDITKLAAENLVQRASVTRRSTTVLRISRCFSEQEKLMAMYRFHRGVDLRDVVQAHCLALDRLTEHGLYIISGPMLFQRSDLMELGRDAARLIERLCPSLSDYFKLNNWPLPLSIDRVYSSELARKELGYRPRFGVDQFLHGDRQPDSLKLPH